MSAQRQRKEEKVEKLRSLFEDAKIIVVAHYDGSSVKDLTDLRDELSKTSGRFQITKNKLALRAAEGTPAAALKDLFTGPTAIAISNDPADAPKVPKVIVEFGKNHEQIRVIGGAMDGALLDEAAVKRLASLPSIDDLRAKLIGLMTMPATQLAHILTQPASQIARLAAARAAQTE